MYPGTCGLSEQTCKRKTPKQKKSVSFSNGETLRRVTIDDDDDDDYGDNFDNNNLYACYPWFTNDEIASTKKRAKSLAALHYLKTRPGQNPPSARAAIVYNCHPAHYEIIGESLRGMEHITDTTKTHSRNRLRSGVISLMAKRQNEQNTSRENNKLACKYVECTNEAMAYSIQIADEDARAADAILKEDLTQDSDALSKLSERNHYSITDFADCPARLFPSSVAA
eukprot:scaffold3792_cov160-Skeletonema_menzelii.AAC.12